MAIVSPYVIYFNCSIVSFIYFFFISYSFVISIPQNAGHAFGGAIGDTPAGPEIQVMMKQQQDILRQEYEGKLADLEKERETIGKL